MRRQRLLSRCLPAIGLLLAGAASAQTYSKTETTAYYDDTSKWVLGQTASVICAGSVPASTACDGDVVSATTFDPTYALPLTQSAFGKLQSTSTYDTTSSVASGQRGTLKTVKDGNNHTTTFTNWKLGIPQAITYANSDGQSAVVNGKGWIDSITDENGYTTGYGYDAMGRLASIDYPAGDTPDWTDTIRSFVQVDTTSEYGIAAGHWRETVTTGDANKITYYDAMWRPLLVREYDAANLSATQRFTRMAYDAEGRVTFASYPSTSSSPTTGVWTEYDPLGRVTSVAQDSETEPLVTVTTYLSGFKRLTTDPNGNSTTEQFMTWDTPGYDLPVLVDAPEDVRTTIARDALGKPTQIARGATP